MSATSASDYEYVVAIDIGTTFSGYAYSTQRTPTTIRANKNWGAGVGVESVKAPTCVLLDTAGKLKYFGYDAQREYKALSEADRKKYLYFERFKMILHTNKVFVLPHDSRL